MIYYLHGFYSSIDSTKGNYFKKKIDAIPIKYRDGPPEKLIISDCLKKIESRIKNDEDVILIGSSFGGYLAARIALDKEKIKKLILLNPSIIPDGIDTDNIASLPIFDFLITKLGNSSLKIFNIWIIASFFPEINNVLLSGLSSMVISGSDSEKGSSNRSFISSEHWVKFISFFSKKCDNAVE